MNWKIYVIRKLGQAYLTRPKSDSVLVTKSELMKLNRGFQHPADDKLLNPPKKARLKEFFFKKPERL